MRFLILLFTVLLFGSCHKDHFDRLGERLIGTWEFDRASKRDTDKPFSSFYSVFAYYEGDRLTFRADETLLYEEANGDTWDGIWSYHRIDGGEDTEFVLSLVLTNDEGDLEQLVWQTNGLIEQNRLRVCGEDKDYEYRFRLCRR